jgi:hypothetical protein
LLLWSRHMTTYSKLLLYQLSYLAKTGIAGFEPATSCLTGKRSNRWTICHQIAAGGIRTHDLWRMSPASCQLLYPALCASRFNHTCLPFYHPSSISIFVHKHTPMLSKRALSISLRRCAYLSSSGRYPACLGMEGFEPPSTRDLSRILSPTSYIPIMSRTNRGIVRKKRSLKTCPP